MASPTGKQSAEALASNTSLESKNRLANVEKKNDDLETRISKLEDANRKRMPYASAESILDAMAALDALANEESFKQTLIENAKAHLTNSLAAGTKRENS